MDSEPSGQTSSDLQRQAAAQIARKKVLAAYMEAAQKKAGASAMQQTTHMKDTPVYSKINSESWRKYHTAWQDYYQKYYSEYYSNAAREYVAKERMKEIRRQAEEEEILDSAFTRAKKNKASSPQFVLGTANAHAAPNNDPRDDDLRRKILKKATDSAR